MPLIFLLWACGTSIENAEQFATSYAESQCYAYKQCYRMLFDGKYDGMSDCEEKVAEKFAEENQTDFPGCALLPEKAEECLAEINQSTCGELWQKEEDIYQACHADVWDCSAASEPSSE